MSLWSTIPIRQIVSPQICEFSPEARLTPYSVDRTKLIIWSNTETGVGLICACLPTLRPIFPTSTVSSLRTWLSSRTLFTSKGSRGTRSSEPGAVDESFRGAGYENIHLKSSNDVERAWLGETSGTLDGRPRGRDGHLETPRDAWERGIRVKREVLVS